MYLSASIHDPETTFRVTHDEVLKQWRIAINEPHALYMGFIWLSDLALVKRLRDALTDAIVAAEVGAAGDAACQEIAAAVAPADGGSA